MNKQGNMEAQKENENHPEIKLKVLEEYDKNDRV